MTRSKIITGACLLVVGFSGYGYMRLNDRPADCQVSPFSEEKNQMAFADQKLNAIVPSAEKNAEINWNLKFGSRFDATISREDLHKARSILDIIPEEASEGIISVESAVVTVLPDESGETVKFSKSEQLTAEQIRLMQTTNYSDGITMRADYSYNHPETGKLVRDYLVYYMTVVPEKQAVYSPGREEFLHYLMSDFQQFSKSIEQEKLQSGRVMFTVTADGRMDQVHLDSSCGYPQVDERIMNAVKNLPGTWIPASNSYGENVEQQFVFFFGNQGC